MMDRWVDGSMEGWRMDGWMIARRKINGWTGGWRMDEE